MQPLERGTGEGVGVDVERFVVGRRGEGPQFCSSKPERRRRVRDGAAQSRESVFVIAPVLAPQRSAGLGARGIGEERRVEAVP